MMVRTNDFKLSSFLSLIAEIRSWCICLKNHHSQCALSSIMLHFLLQKLGMCHYTFSLFTNALSSVLLLEMQTSEQITRRGTLSMCMFGYYIFMVIDFITEKLANINRNNADIGCKAYRTVLE